MSSVTKSIRLYAWQPNYHTFKAVQGEARSRRFDIQLMDATFPVDLTGCSVQFYAAKPDSTIVYTDCTIIDAAEGLIRIYLPEQVTVVSGIVKCWIQVVSTDGSDLRFDGANLEVLECSLEAGVPSEDDERVFEQALARLIVAENTLSAVKSEVEDARGTYPSLRDRENAQDESLTPGDIGAATSDHKHGNITNDGRIGTTANRAVYTGTGGILQSGILPLAAGGLGASTANGARDNIGAAAKSMSVTVTALADSWSGGVQIISVTGVTANNNIWVGLASTATEEQRQACRDAIMATTAQDAGTITVVCDGDVPAVDIPISVVILG